MARVKSFMDVPYVVSDHDEVAPLYATSRSTLAAADAGASARKPVARTAIFWRVG